MPTTVYVASTNPGKLRDFVVAANADEHGEIILLPLPNIDRIAPPAEDEAMFEGNARKKAIYYSQHLPGELVLADDSGLEVDALHGMPGVRSARYALDADAPIENGETVDERNNRLLLREMAPVPDKLRGAQYRCVLALARGGTCLLTAEGSVTGQILTEAAGDGGFGYDPLFFLPELARTMAQIDLDTKHRISHRGRAFRALLDQLHRSTW